MCETMVRKGGGGGGGIGRTKKREPLFFRQSGGDRNIHVCGVAKWRTVHGRAIPVSIMLFRWEICICWKLPSSSFASNVLLSSAMTEKPKARKW